MTNHETVRDFYEKLGTLMDALGIKYMPERLWNYDETGLFYVVKPGRAITAVDKRYVYKRVYANRAECAKFYPTSDQLGLFQNGGGDDQNNVVSPSLGNSIEAKKEISTKNDEEPNVQSNKFEESIAALDNNQHNCATETLESIAIKELLEAHDKANCVGMFIKCRTSQNCFPQTKLLHDALLYLGHSLRQQALMMVLQLCCIVKTIQRIPMRARIRGFSARVSESC
uniref:Uncharacterized protein n=1 Tax=Timema bartmani TaxID=61472 RepID=A0A7R9I579_9NEOP|nr:unnamed protein product [Timema bartmani]